MKFRFDNNMGAKKTSLITPIFVSAEYG
jgi:hypothetical protein